MNRKKDLCIHYQFKTKHKHNTMIEKAAALPKQTPIVNAQAPEQESELKHIVCKKLGDGAQATVYKAHIEGDSHVGSVALKLFSKSSNVNRNGQPENEYELLSKLDNHPNVVKVYDFISSKGQVQIPRSIPRN